VFRLARRVMIVYNTIPNEIRLSSGTKPPIPAQQQQPWNSCLQMDRLGEKWNIGSRSVPVESEPIDHVVFHHHPVAMTSHDASTRTRTRTETTHWSASPRSSLPPSPTMQPAKKKRKRCLVSGSWNERFQELIQFREENDHCFVPHTYPQNPKLSQWVRKQRHQRKRKEKGLHSTLSDERQELLTNAGFIWDSHRAQWQERYQSLEIFHMTNGHCNVPSSYYDSSLSNWVKNQRKQFKIFQAGSTTAMDEDRIELLNSLGFNWNPRGL